MTRARRGPVRAGAGLASLLLVLGAEDAAAQIPKLTAEARLGAAVPVAELAEGGDSGGGATAGPSFGVSLAYAVRGGLYLHLGFGEHRFECSDGCAGVGDLTATGFDLALRYLFDVGPIRPWVRAGALPYTVEAATAESGGPSVSDHVWGFEAGGGVAFPVSESVWLAPGARYVSLEPRFEDGDALRLRGWVIDLGIAWAF